MARYWFFWLDINILWLDIDILRPDIDILRLDIDILRPYINILRPDIDILWLDINILWIDINILWLEIYILRLDIDTTSIFPNFCKIVFLYPVNLHFTAHSILHSTAPIVWLTTSIFPDCCKIIFLPWAVFHSTVNQCILNSYAMITHYHYERLGYFDDQQVLYDEHSGDYQDVFDARATWFRSFILMPCFIQSIPRYTRVVTILCRHYIG